MTDINSVFLHLKECGFSEKQLNGVKSIFNLKDDFYVVTKHQYDSKKGEFNTNEDETAIHKQFSDGSHQWTVNGVRHSIDDKPAFVCKHGTEFWYYKGKIHRDHGCGVGW